MSGAGRDIVLRPIGIVRSPHRTPAGTPIQPAYAASFEGEIVIDEDLAPALVDIEGFERLWLVTFLDCAGPFVPRVVPYRDTREHGLFATRSPCRPNAIGISVVRLLGRAGNVLRIGAVDTLDGTPLLDLKPYVPEFDAHPSSKTGWLERSGADRRMADGRFHPDGKP
jgi:tRNA-Thr(GGU) m(6)t(6)A37 methyltransferase TsaA